LGNQLASAEELPRAENLLCPVLGWYCWFRRALSIAAQFWRHNPESSIGPGV
jgi:hypothetical protein